MFNKMVKNIVRVLRKRGKEEISISEMTVDPVTKTIFSHFYTRLNFREKSISFLHAMAILDKNEFIVIKALLKQDQADCYIIFLFINLHIGIIDNFSLSLSFFFFFLFFYCSRFLDYLNLT